MLHLILGSYMLIGAALIIIQMFDAVVNNRPFRLLGMTFIGLAWPIMVLAVSINILRMVTRRNKI